jgi:hypothetical protein
MESADLVAQRRFSMPLRVTSCYFNIAVPCVWLLAWRIQWSQLTWMHVSPRYLALGLLYCSAGASAHPPPAVFFFWKAHPERYSRRSYAEPDLRIPARVGTAGELAQIKSIWEVPADWEPLNLWEALPRDERVRHMCLRMKRDQETTSCACVWEWNPTSNMLHMCKWMKDAQARVREWSVSRQTLHMSSRTTRD